MSKLVFMYVAFHLSLTLVTADAHFCDWNTCKTEEYCCGENKCCLKDSEDLLWFFLIGVGLAAILLLWYILFKCGVFASLVEIIKKVFAVIHLRKTTLS